VVRLLDFDSRPFESSAQFLSACGVSRQLDESAAPENLTIGRGHDNKRHECLWVAYFRWDLNRLLLGPPCESFGTVTLPDLIERSPHRWNLQRSPRSSR
jgi:hypothetical protein